MRITQVNIPEHKAKEHGLHEVQMKKLGNVVIIAGKNGSGKTRLLSMIESHVKAKPTDSSIEKARSDNLLLPPKIEQLNTKINKLIEDERRLEKKGAKQEELEAIRQRTGSLNSSRKEYSNQLKKADENINWDYINIEPSGNSYSGFHYSPKETMLNDSYKMSKQNLENSLNNASNIGTDNINQYALPRIQDILNKYLYATHPETTYTPSEIENAKDNYIKLKQYIRILLGADLNHSNGDATLFGFRLGESKLSEGQSVLLQLSIALHSQEGPALENTVLFMDEPESHLHPAALLEVIDKIISAVPNGQIWIATHSLSILSHFDPSCIWYMDDGKIKHAGKVPEQVLNTLLGNDENKQELHEFLS